MVKCKAVPYSMMLRGACRMLTWLKLCCHVEEEIEHSLQMLHHWLKLLSYCATVTAQHCNPVPRCPGKARGPCLSGASCQEEVWC